MTSNILRMSTVLARTGLSRTSIYRRIEDSGFPKPVSLGGRSIGWIEAEVDDWIKRRIEEHRFESRKN